MIRSLKLNLVFSLGLLFLASCGVPPSDGQKTAVGKSEETFAGVYQVLNNNNCISCHSPGGAAHDVNGVELDFSSLSSAYQSLISSKVTGVSSSGTCGGVRIVAPGNPRASYLAAVVISSYNTANFGGVAGCQPYTGHLQDTNLTVDEQSALVAWIQNGARAK